MCAARCPGLTYTALGGSAFLLDVQVTEFTTGSLSMRQYQSIGARLFC